MARLAVDRPRMDRLFTVLELELGHELAFAVERGKIAANTDKGQGGIDMGFIEPGLFETITREVLDDDLADNQTRLRKAIVETLDIAGVEPGRIGHVVLVGGSSLMRFVSDEIRAICPDADIIQSDAFTAVVDGLALATRR